MSIADPGKRGQEGDVGVERTIDSSLVLSIARTLNERFQRQVGEVSSSADAGIRRQKLRAFLTSLLPSSRFRIASGTLFDARGQTARSDALFIVEASAAPVLPFTDNDELLPAEAVYATIHLIPSLTQERLAGGLKEVAALKSLERQPVLRGEDTVNDCASVILAFDGLHGDRLLAALAEENRSTPFARQPDLVVVLGRGVATFVETDPDGSVIVDLPLQPSARHRLSWVADESSTFLLFYLLLWETLRARTLRWPSVQKILSMLSATPSKTLAVAHGLDRGE